MIYVINIILIFFYYVFFNLISVSEDRRKKIFLFICSIQIIIIVGTRTVYTGRDTITYNLFFQRIISTNSIAEIFGRFEPLFSLLCWCLGKLGAGFMWLNISMAFLTMFFFSKAIYKMSSNVYLSMILYVSCFMFYQMMNQYRQILSCAIVLYAVSFLHDGKKKQFIGWVVIAALFHYSAIVALVLLPMDRFEIKKRTVEIYLIILILIPVLQNVLITVASYTKYGYYLSSHFDNHLQRSTIYNLGVRIVLLLVCFFFYKRIKKNHVDYNADIFFHMIIICTILQVLTTQRSLFGRLTTYFFYAYFILVPEIASYGYRGKNNKTIVVIVTISIFSLYHWVYFSQTSDANGITTYASYLF